MVWQVVVPGTQIWTLTKAVLTPPGGPASTVRVSTLGGPGGAVGWVGGGVPRGMWWLVGGRVGRGGELGARARAVWPPPVGPASTVRVSTLGGPGGAMVWVGGGVVVPPP